MSKEYQDKLRAFISEIPAAPGQITSGGPHRPPYSAAFKEQLKDLKFDLPTNPLFLKYTKTTHLTLVRNWSTGGIMTTCNGFAGVCGMAMGAKHFLGQFELQAYLKKINKGHAWVPANSGRKPAYGDIFKAASFHMGVSLGVEDNQWLTVEGGQGGSISGFDIVKRKRRMYNPAAVEGWVDMEIYLDPRPGISDWLPGTWIIYSGDKTRYYGFDAMYQATHYQSQGNSYMKEAVPLNTGIVEFYGMDDFVVKWNRGATFEEFHYDRFSSFPGLNEKATGKGYKKEPLSAVKIDDI